MHYLYIIYSEKADRYYCGESPDVLTRLNLHNSHHFKNAFTKIADDWKIKLIHNFDHRKDAKYLEAFIKRMKSRKFIEKVISKPDSLSDIILKK